MPQARANSSSNTAPPAPDRAHDKARLPPTRCAVTLDGRLLAPAVIFEERALLVLLIIASFILPQILAGGTEACCATIEGGSQSNL